MADVSRVIIHLRIDDFYSQVEQKRANLQHDESLIIQFGNGLLSLNAAARALGVRRHMNVEYVKKTFPELKRVVVAEANHLDNAEYYKEESALFFRKLFQFQYSTEKVGLDAAYLDVTFDVEARLATMQPLPVEISDWKWTGHVADAESPIWKSLNRDQLVRLWLGDQIAALVRATLRTCTTFTFSAGVAENKWLSKIALGTNTPNQQTVLPFYAARQALKDAPVEEMEGSGVQNLVASGIKTVGELAAMSFDKTFLLAGPDANRICRLSIGQDGEPVQNSNPTSLGFVDPVPDAPKTVLLGTGRVPKNFETLCKSSSKTEGVLVVHYYQKTPAADDYPFVQVYPSSVFEQSWMDFLAQDPDMLEGFDIYYRNQDGNPQLVTSRLHEAVLKHARQTKILVIYVDTEERYDE